MSESIVRRHYEALGRHQLLAHKCKACGHVTFPMTSCCEECASYEYQEVPLSGRGTLLFASHGVAPPPHPRFAKFAPYVYGHVMLAEGVVTQGIIRGVEGTPEAVQTLFGQLPKKVQLDVLQTDDLPVMAFKLA
ncbi:MAG: Zn-ribbon domain-containing OB-fold protein [Myxococcota bacterium]